MAPNQRPRTAPSTRRPRVAGRPSPTRRTPDTAPPDTAPPADGTQPPETTDTATRPPTDTAAAQPGHAPADTAESVATQPQPPEPDTTEPAAADTTTAAEDHAETAEDAPTVAVPAETADDTEAIRDTWTRTPATGTPATGTPATGTPATETPAAEPTRRPRPAPREGAPTGRRRDADEMLAYPPQSEVSRPAARAKTDGRRANPYVLPVVLIVVAVLLGAFAAFAATQASGYGEVDTANRALADDSATRTVLQQTTTALNTMFSFDYRNPDKTRTDSANLTTGQIGGTYQQLMSVLRDQGPRNQLSLSSAVLTSGVERLQGDKAQVLALLSQTYSKGTGAAARQSPVLAMVRVDLTQTGGTWKVANLTLLSS